MTVHEQALSTGKAQEKAASQAKAKAKPYVNGYLGGILLGLLLFLDFFLTGNGLGASGGINHLLAWVIDLIAPRYVETHPYWARYAGGTLRAWDSWIVFVVLGMLIGGFVSSRIHGRWRVVTNKGPKISVRMRWLMAFLGGTLMGYGARLARGCTSGQALSGGAVLSAGSWAFMLSLFAGAYLLAYFFRDLWN